MVGEQLEAPVRELPGESEALLTLKRGGGQGILQAQGALITVNLFTWHHLRWALVMAGITLATLLVAAYVSGDGEPQPAVQSTGESRDSFGTTEGSGQGRAGSDESSPIDSNSPTHELQLSDNQRSTATSGTAPTEPEPMTLREILLFLGLPEVKNGTVQVPPAHTDSTTAPSATPSP